MILDVARAPQFVEVVVALELLEKLLRRLAEDIDEDVDSAAVRHADDDLVNPRRAALVDQVIQHRNEAVAAFE